MTLPTEIEREDDDRWLAEIPELPGVLAYGASPAEAVARVQALALRTLADRVEHGEAVLGGTLRDYAEAVLARFNEAATRQAAAETGLSLTTFPTECPYTIEALQGLDLLAD